MSNSAVGQTYANIIESTIQGSHADFLEAGVSLDYLEALRTIWQSKLTNTRVASFPWVSAPSPPPPAPVPVLEQSPTPSSDRPVSQPVYHNPAMAALRAMQQVQQVQHNTASQSENPNGAASVVNQLAAMARLQDEQFKQEQEQRKLREEEERRMRIQIKREEDDLFGDDEYDLHSSKRRLSQIDSPEESIRPAPSFVAGSLLSNTSPVDPDSDLDAPHDPESPRNQYLDPTQLITPQSTQKKPKKEIDPLDDAINSDLDDSDIQSDLDSEFGEGDDADDSVGDKSIVLCMYEKVHRTKNKWKCQLKDGVISIGGKDWVFSKANGEFEW